MVSRIEVTAYAHGATELLGVQIDAAINSGNSGGCVPVFFRAGAVLGRRVLCLAVVLPTAATAAGVWVHLGAEVVGHSPRSTTSLCLNPEPLHFPTGFPWLQARV